MATAQVLTMDDTFAIIQRWEQDGPTLEERGAYADAMLSHLDSTGFGSLQGETAFQDNIGEAANSAKSLDQMFEGIEITFKSLATIVYAIIHPDMIGYYQEWTAFRKRWRSSLYLSTEVAQMTVEMLERFDSVYLNQVQNIKTEQDRLAAMKALGQFIDESYDKSTELSRGFLDLKRDITVFLERFTNWVAINIASSSFLIAFYKTLINSLQAQIEGLNQQIQGAHQGHAIAGSSFQFLGMFAPQSPIVIIFLQKDRDNKLKELRDLQGNLASVEFKEEPILKLRATLDVWKPDLDLLCQRLVAIAEIWSTVRSQAVQFRGHLEGGLGATSNMRFKTEVRLARAVCAPLTTGLMRYIYGLAPLFQC